MRTSKLLLFSLMSLVCSFVDAQLLSAKSLTPVYDIKLFSIEDKLRFELLSAFRGGTQDGGGGDPRAIRILENGKKAVSWLLVHSHPGFDVSELDLLYRIKKISYTLSLVPQTESMIQFKQTQDILCSNELKKGCTYANGTIEIAGLYWDHLSTTDQDRCALSLIELLRPQNIDKLYEKAADLCRVMDINAEGAVKAEDPRFNCEQHEANFKTRVESCSSYHGEASCVLKYYKPFKLDYPQCAASMLEYCIKKCASYHGSASCVDRCDK